MANTLENAISDHHGVECVVNTGVLKEQFSTPKIRNFNEKNLNLTKQALKLENWESVYAATDPETKLNELLKIVTLHMNHFAAHP